MPKRKHATDDFDYIKKKMKKLERKLKRARRRNQEISSSSRDSTPSPSEDSSDVVVNQMMMDTDTENIPPPEDMDSLINNIVQINTETASGDKNVASNANSENVVATSTKSNDLLSEEALKTVNPEEHIALDSDIMEILGIDPAASVEYGKEIHKELASRLEHISITGLTKESRKELKEKYLLPSNGTLLGAPLLNPEIKAALPETLLNRDKALETKQKLLGNAISCLATAITQLLKAKDKNNDLLKHLMDTGRILCDVQHADSLTRRNFSFSCLKKDIKDQLQNTKIDKFLFGEKLSDTLKAAKAVTRSGAEIKTPSNIANHQKPKPSTSKTAPLNWKSSAPARKPQGPLKSREPAYRQNQPVKSSKPLQPPKQNRRR